MEGVLTVLHEEKVPTKAPDILGDNGRTLPLKKRVAVVAVKNPQVQKNALSIADPAGFLDALFVQDVHSEVDKQYYVRSSYPSYAKRLQKLAGIGRKHTGVECPLVGLTVVLKAFDDFDDAPKDSSVRAYEMYVLMVISVLLKFFGEYTAKQIARAACQCFAPTDASPAQQLAAARRLHPDQNGNLKECDGLIFDSISIWDYAALGCMLNGKVAPGVLKRQAANLRAYQADHMKTYGVFASPSVYPKLCRRWEALS
jgi:hypothetical protein